MDVGFNIDNTKGAIKKLEKIILILTHLKTLQEMKYKSIVSWFEIPATDQN